MKIAIEGCCHGKLDAIFDQIHQLEVKNQYTVDVLLICGDFQAIRNQQDLQCMAVPDKYKELGSFYKYYMGEKIAPLLTIVIGGNHEASNYMWELYHGGWLAPNIYFLGHAGCVQVNGVRIAGASGIFKSHDFRKGNYETMPYDAGMMRSIYHIREYNVRKLSLLSSPRVFLSHDWPQSIEQHGNLSALLSRKKFLRQDIQTGQLGSPPLMGLLRTLRPQWWFAAHLHTRFQATVIHNNVSVSVPVSAPVKVKNPDEIMIDDEDVDLEDGLQFKVDAEPPTSVIPSSDPPVPRNPDEVTLDDEEEDLRAPPLPSLPRAETKFLALDKCLPKRQFLEVIDLPIAEDQSAPELSDIDRRPPVLSFDPEWLAITRAFHPWLSTTRSQRPFPEETEARAMVQKELGWVMKNVKNKVGDAFLLSECQTFTMTAPGPGSEGSAKFQQPSWYTNPQTKSFCAMLELENKINPPPPGSHLPHTSGTPSSASVASISDPSNLKTTQA